MFVHSAGLREQLMSSFGRLRLCPCRSKSDFFHAYWTDGIWRQSTKRSVIFVLLCVFCVYHSVQHDW